MNIRTTLLIGALIYLIIHSFSQLRQVKPSLRVHTGIIFRVIGLAFLFGLHFVYGITGVYLVALLSVYLLGAFVFYHIKN